MAELDARTLSLQMDLIPRIVDDSATGKTRASLNTSRARRTEILRLFKGELPQSIMVADKKQRATDLTGGSYYATAKVVDDSRLATIFDVSGQSVRAGALSQFPQNIGRAVVLLYSKEGDTVIDPFAGHNSRMELCVRAGRHYVGHDISARFMEWNRRMAVQLRYDNPQASITLIEGDSRQMNVESCSGDFTLTSPPYYNLEDYGDEPEQLGKLGGYGTFLDGLAGVARENFRALRPGAFCVWFVNDFRLGGRFYSYHTDTLGVLVDAGFTPWDMLIVDLGAPIRAAFAAQVIDQQILPKRHEYGIVVRKPGE